MARGPTYHCDYRGSTVAITDASGNVIDRVSYSPYGSIVSRSGSNDTPFLSNATYGVMTEQSGLLYMRARYYNPTTCRFANPDPLGFGGGANFYAQANGNPVNLIDPTGLYAKSSESVYIINNAFGSDLPLPEWLLLSHTFLAVTKIDPVNGSEFVVATYSWVPDKGGSYEDPLKNQNLIGAYAAIAFRDATRLGGTDDARFLQAAFENEKQRVGGFFDWRNPSTYLSPFLNCKIAADTLWREAQWLKLTDQLSNAFSSFEHAPSWLLPPSPTLAQARADILKHYSSTTDQVTHGRALQ